jgi:hypothetical protein
MSDPFDMFVKALEDMIDAQDEMFEEEKNCNYRHELKIREEKYLPAKQAMRDAFNRAVRHALTDTITVQKNYFMEQ